MMTTIEGRRRRSKMGLDGFADITTAPVVEMTSTAVTFDGTLTAQQIKDVRWRFTSIDDADEAERRDIAALVATDTTASPLTQRLAAYLLGES